MPDAPNASRLRLLGAALQSVRTKGYSATTVDDLCAAAGVTKGSFFHHFKGKEDLALQAVQHWNAVTASLFEQAPYQRLADPRARLLAYIDFRAELLQGAVPDFTCLLGTLVQETFVSHPTLREACARGIHGHAATVAAIANEARAMYAPKAAWSGLSLALYTQAVLQGAFVLAKAEGGATTAAQCMTHLRRHVECLLPRPVPRPRRQTTKGTRP